MKYKENLFDQKEKILGMAYNGKFILKETIFPISKEKETVYKGKISFGNYYNVKNIEANIKVERKDGLWIGEGKISAEKPLEAYFEIEEKRLRLPSDFNLFGLPLYVKEKEKADKIIRELNITSRPFNYRSMLKILNWMSANLSYKNLKNNASSSIDYTLNTKNGKCDNFAFFFEYFVTRCGGICRTVYGGAVNRVVDGKPIFKTVPIGARARHAWNEVYLERWHLVDPTVYINSKKERKERAINQTLPCLFPNFFLPNPKFLDSPKEFIKKGGDGITEATIQPKIIFESKTPHLESILKFF